MALMKLSVSSFPFSLSGVAGIALMVSVTDADGKPYTSLQKPNFEVRWIDNVKIDESIVSMTLTEYRSTNAFPDLPGVYCVELISENASWSQITTFYIAVHEDQNHGQILYRIDDTAFRQMTR